MTDNLDPFTLYTQLYTFYPHACSSNKVHSEIFSHHRASRQFFCSQIALFRIRKQHEIIGFKYSLNHLMPAVMASESRCVSHAVSHSLITISLQQQIQQVQPALELMIFVISTLYKNITNIPTLKQAINHVTNFKKLRSLWKFLQ